MDRFRKLIACGVLFLTLVLSIGAVAPKEIRLERASYRKITISWQAPDATTQVAHYKIYRDGTELATTTSLNYTDETVQPGTKYTYKILAVIVGGGDSEFSSELPVRTLKSATFENNQLVENVVNSFHDTPKSNLNAVFLISAVKAGFEALLGSNISFSVIDESIVTTVIVEELNWINTVTPELTEAERLAVQAEIDTMMDSSFGGNSFDHMFINQKLTQLGDKHWEAGNKTAAELFYEFSLNYLSNHESTVSGTLFRLAYFAKNHLTQDSSCADISESLGKAKAHSDRFFDFFPNPATTSTHAKSALSQPVGWYFSYFPKMLDYSNYDALFFSTAHEAAKRLAAFDPADKNAVQRLERVAAWELINLQLRFVDENGNPRTGGVKICNVSAENGKGYLFHGDAYVDEREFTLTNGTATVPVYAGHDYSISLNVDVANGNKLKFELPVFKYEKNKLVSYDYLTNSFTETSSSQSRTDFVISSAAYPYNLRADRGIDVFDLSWDWVAPESFTTAGFKVFRGNTEVASSTKQTVRLPLNNSANEYNYKVVAVDANGNLSTASQVITVYPGDQSQYSDFFDWMNSYFGDSAVYASDDPDNDGVDNYHEFLNGTDPTKVPGPMPYAGPRGFNELTLEWDAVSSAEGTTYQISRNGTVVGTSTTTKFTDTNLVPGVSYIYKIKLLTPAAVATDWGLPNTLSTQKAHNYEHADKVQQVVDQFLKLNILEYTGPTLVSAVKSSLETLTGSNITFTVINPELVEKMVDQELEMLREVSPQLTTAERIAARNELNKMMEESWAGNSFEEMFINTKLTELAEDHWLEYLADKTKVARKTAAIELYEASLLFLTNHEPSVRNTLARLAQFEMQNLDANSTDVQIKNALISARDTMLRIYTYFPEPADFTSNPYRTIISNYRKFFPRLLAYDKYDQALFDNALQLAAVYRDQDVTDATRRKLYNEVESWKLVQLKLSCGVSNAVITLTNVTPYYPSDPWTEKTAKDDTRTFTVAGESLTVPVYAGHTYDMTIKVPVAGGEDWIRTISGIKFGAGIKTTDNPQEGIVTENIADTDSNSEFIFPVNSVTFPYNLQYQALPGTFTLSWNYVPAQGAVVDHYNIYRGNTLVTTSQGTTCSGIPRIVCADGVYTYSVSAVDAAGFESNKSPIIQVLPDFTEEEKKYFEWKQKYFGNAAVLATDDNDQDGLTNYQEFLLGSNPKLAPTNNPKDSITNVLPGGIIKYYSDSFSAYPVFESLLPYKTDTIRSINQSSTEGDILTSGRSNNLALFIKGYFDIAKAGIYRFYLNANGGAELTLDKAVLINFRKGGSNDRYVDIYLDAGTHLLELGYFKKSTQAALQLSWAGPDFARTTFGSALWHTDNDESLLAETISWQKDSDFDGIPDRVERSKNTDPFSPDTDGDGLTDHQELYTFFTNPTMVDTDGDGIDDCEEVQFALSNPLVVDFTGLPQVLQTLAGKNFSSSSDGWYSNGNSVDCLNRKGNISYQIIIPSKSVYVLEVTGQNALSSENNVDFDLDMEIAGTVCKAKKLISNAGGSSTIRFYLPMLTAGTYSAKLIWNNIDQDKALRINQVRLLALNGPDSNSNSVADWIDHRMIMLQKNNIPAISLTSPLCIEGNKGVAVTEIQVSSIAGSQKPYTDTNNNIVWAENSDARIANGELTLVIPQVQDSVKNQFYANVELSPESGTVITVNRGGAETTQNVEWKETNILSTPTITIRKGDALLLSVRPTDSISGSAVATIGNEHLTFTTENTKIPYRFNEAGTFSVLAEFTPANGTAVSGEMVVKVVEASFAGVPYSIAGIERSWQNAKIPAEAVLESDNNIMIFRSNTASGANISFYGKESGRYNIVARLGENGPVMAASQVCILDSSTHKADGYYKVIDTFDDGTKLIEGKIILSEVPADLNIRLAIYTTGTTFLDGTLVKTLTAADFDENGVCRYQMLKTDGSPTSTCHGISFYQGNTFLFSYKN